MRRYIQMIYSYNCVKQKKLSESKEEYTAYGIALGENILVGDVTSDETFAEEIIERLNAFQASPVHILEIIEDMIVQRYS